MPPCVVSCVRCLCPSITTSIPIIAHAGNGIYRELAVKLTTLAPLSGGRHKPREMQFILAHKWAIVRVTGGNVRLIQRLFSRVDRPLVTRDGRVVPTPEEETVFQLLGMPPVPPERRSGEEW